jgi:two-component system sensor histidine kinase BaeS
MIEYFRQHLGLRLFLSYLAVILVGAVVLVVATWFTTPTAYNRHLGMMSQMTDNSGMMGMMEEDSANRPGLRRGQGSGYAGELYTSFQQSFSEALTWAALAAGTVALAVSLYLSQRVVRPVRAMMAASQRIAAGNYDERVPEDSSDELGQLARSYNQMALQLQDVESRRRQLIGDVAHELRTPLTAIKGSMEGLIDGLLPASPGTYEQIYQEADRLNRLVDDLQELSRVESGAYQLDIHPVELASLVKTVVKRLGGQFKAKGVALTVDLPADLPAVQADGDRIIQVLTNLISNALRYTPQGGEVTLLACRHGNDVQTTVKDTGIGIAREHLPHIFTRFYRVDKSRSRQAGGSGIGLTIAKHLVESHGGSMRVESQGEGQGSAFTFTLPSVE